MSKILWLSWKDYHNPQFGGAEVVGHEIRKRLVSDGHSVTHLTGNFKNGATEETIDGVKTIRVNASKAVLALATYIYYSLNLRGKFDTIIEEVNTSPYFAHYYKGKSKHFLFYHQLTGAVWNYELQFPMNVIGQYILEPIALFLSSFAKDVIAMSPSTKKDLQQHGFKNNNIAIIPEATNMPGLAQGESTIKHGPFTFVYFGSLRRMKRPEDVIKGFAHGLKNTDAHLTIAGSSTIQREEELKSLIKQLHIESQVTWTGRLTDKEQYELFKKSHVYCMTSVKEGWGIVIMEAGLLEMPSIAYDVDGLRDAVINKKTGILVTDGNTNKLGEAMLYLYNNPELTKAMGKQARIFNEQFSFDKTYEEFKKATTL